MRRHIFITSAPATGKTTACKRLIEAIGRQQPTAPASKAAAAATAATRSFPLLVPGSFVTEELRERGQRVGFQFRFFGTDDPLLREPVLLAATAPQQSSATAFTVGKYAVRVDNVDSFVVPLLRSMAKRTQQQQQQQQRCVAVIDEIGKMECLSRSFCSGIEALLSSPQLQLRVVATVPLHGIRFIEALKAREDVSLVELTLENRDALVAQILEEVCR